MMNGTEYVRIPKFMAGEELPSGYFDSPNPYKDPPLSKYNLRAMVNYALKNGKNVTDLTKEEVKPFLNVSENLENRSIGQSYSACDI